MERMTLHQLPKVPDYELPTDSCCPICFPSYENPTPDSGSFERAVRLPCNHLFGSECLSEWLTQNKTCPLCRYNLTIIHERDNDTEEYDLSIFWQTFHMQHSQEWDEYWYGRFWILRVHGKGFVEQKWRDWRRDWIEAAEHIDASSVAHAKAALAQSRPRDIPSNNDTDDDANVRFTASAIQTVRFREYHLYLRLLPEGEQRSELRASPGFQLTPAQEDVLFRELERKGAFKTLAADASISRRKHWNQLRNIGFVWDVKSSLFGHSMRGRWTNYSY